ncbi:MAG TPA: PDZ domain-containing protein [Polyangiales bacterium]|nr:PDZ domain-containing protein [Polyangiales bacterium]
MSYTGVKVVNLFDLSRIATALGGLPIPGCQPGSPAARAGIRYGDIVLALNGARTASWAEFFQARRHATGPLVARVFRAGIELEITLDLPNRARTPREVLDECALLPSATRAALRRAEDSSARS